MAGSNCLEYLDPVAIDQAYFRYNAYVLPVVGLIAIVLYLGLALTSQRVRQKVHSLHSDFIERPLIYALVVGSFLGLLILLLGAGEWASIQASKAHRAELHAKDNPPVTTAGGPPATSKEPALPLTDKFKARTPTVEPAKPHRAAPKKQETPAQARDTPSSSGGTTTSPVTVQPGAVASFGQQGGQTAGIINNNGPRTPTLPVPLQEDLASLMAPYTGSFEVVISAPATYMTEAFGNAMAAALSKHAMVNVSRTMFVGGCQASSEGIALMVGSNRIAQYLVWAKFLVDKGVFDKDYFQTTRFCSRSGEPNEFVIVIYRP